MKKIYILFFIANLTTTSCSVLDQVSPSQVPYANVFVSQAGAESALLGLYSSMQNSYYYGVDYPLISDLYTDVIRAGGFNVTALAELNAYSVSTSNIIVQNMWVSMYYTVATANGILDNIYKIMDTVNFPTAKRDSIAGHAHAIRALAHFDLLRMYGQHWDQSSAFGIPIITKTQTVTDVAARNTVADTYKSIISDLKMAANMIPANPPYDNAYLNPVAVQGLLARIYLYQKDYVNATTAATNVIQDGNFKILDQNSFLTIYSGRQSKESLFELVFNVQNRSGYNSATYSRTNALLTEVNFLADSTLNIFFTNRPGDLRSSLVDFDPNIEANFLPMGRSQKYRGEVNQDNSAFIIRMAEVYLIRAEAQGATNGLIDLNIVRTNRGLAALQPSDITTIYNGDWTAAILDERFAELNFEGHRMFDLARTQRRNLILNGSGVDDFTDIFPIPNREIIASKGIVVQNPGY